MENQKDQTVLVAKYFLDHFSWEILFGKESPKNKQDQLAYKYCTQALEVFAVFDRLCRYEVYFAEFLPSKTTGISESEALEYHLRNYVQEFYILRERVQKIVRDLKDDLPNYQISSTKDVEKTLNHIADNIDRFF